MKAGQDRTSAAAAAVLSYAVIVTYLDNYVRVIATDAGLWQFHATRALIALPLILVLTKVMRIRLWPHDLRAVCLRSTVHGAAMLIYFGALAFLPVAQVVAGLFAAPIFVLLINRYAYGHPIGIWQIIAVTLGFGGVVMVLGPDVARGASIASLLPVLAGALYALGNIATREWCGREGALTLLFGFFMALGLFGSFGMLVLWIYPLPVATGADGFLARGAVWPTERFLFWTLMQALGSLVAVGLMIKGYQLANAAKVAVFEYALLPAAAGWSWLIWSETLDLVPALGMVLITAAGLLIALAPDPHQAALSPTS